MLDNKTATPSKQTATAPQAPWTLRPVSPSDAADITIIYNRYIAETTISFETEPLTVEQMRQRIGTLSAFPYFVCEEAGAVVGYCYAHPWKERAAYARTLETTVYLAHGACHRGIATALMHRLIDACRQRGFHTLIACITDDNAASIRFHERLGFTAVSHFHEVGRKFGRWLGVVDMELRL